MKYHLLIILISAVLLGGCAKKSSETSQDTSVNPENSTAVVQTGEVENQNNSFVSPPTFVAEKAMSSKFPGVTVMKDGFGNTVETRHFSDHPRIICVIVRTNANGERVATVYGHNGDRRALPEYKIADAFTDDANRLADVAGIWEGRKEEPRPLPPIKMVVSEPLPVPVTNPEAPKNEASETSDANLPKANETSSNQPEPKSDPTLLNPKNLEK